MLYNLYFIEWRKDIKKPVSLQENHYIVLHIASLFVSYNSKCESLTAHESFSIDGFNDTDELSVDVGGSEGYIRLSVLISEHTGLPLQGVPRIGHGGSEVDGIRFIEFPLGIVASC